MFCAFYYCLLYLWKIFRTKDKLTVVYNPIDTPFGWVVMLAKKKPTGAASSPRGIRAEQRGN